VALEEQVTEERLDAVNGILVKEGDRLFCGGWWINCMRFPGGTGW